MRCGMALPCASKSGAELTIIHSIYMLTITVTPRLVNLVVSPGIKYKQSSMPFVQMENISNFLKACQMPPLSLPPHDVFLTVDLYEAKDPLQVLQCVSALSRRANALKPSRFPRTIGAKSKGGVLSSHLTGSSQGGYASPGSRVVSNVSDANSTFSGRSTPTKSPKAPVSTWSKPSDEYTTVPAWNIHQYGYMGGASQGNQGVTFGARRQITTASPSVPSLAEKEKRRREEEERQRLQAQETGRSRQIEREAEEERARAEEERRWNEDTARMREAERRHMEEEKKQWAEEQRRWEEEEQRRLAEEREVEERLEKERQHRRGISDARLNGQFLSQYRASQAATPSGLSAESKESQRIKELERELELAKEREHQYERELHEKENRSVNRPSSPNRPRPVPPKPSYDLSSLEQERRLLRSEWQKHQDAEPAAPPKPPRPLPDPTAMSSSTNPPPKPPRPLPEPSTSILPRPLPDPAAYSSNKGGENRVDRFLSSNPAPVAPKPSTHLPQDYSSTAEIDAENNRRIASQQKTRAGGWASKSLLEREMERERERQREWEENQKQVKAAAEKGLKDPSLGTGPGEGAWDVHQYGYLGGDNQNRGGPGLGFGGRRQIIGPKPPL